MANWALPFELTENHMKRVLTLVLSTLAYASVALAAPAFAKECKDGKVYDPDTGKCVTEKGS